MNGELCPHGRVIGHVCLDCPTGTAEQWEDVIMETKELVGAVDWKEALSGISDDDLEEISVDELKRKPGEADWSDDDFTGPDIDLVSAVSALLADHSENSGTNADYYRLPLFSELIEMIEWLEEGGMTSAGMNTLKSLVREYNPHAKKETTALYEAGKRLYYTFRHYLVVWRRDQMEQRGKRLRAAAEEEMQKPASGTVFDEGEDQ